MEYPNKYMHYAECNQISEPENKNVMKHSQKAGLIFTLTVFISTYLCVFDDANTVCVFTYIHFFQLICITTIANIS